MLATLVYDPDVVVLSRVGFFLLCVLFYAIGVASSAFLIRAILDAPEMEDGEDPDPTRPRVGCTLRIAEADVDAA